VTSEYPVEYNSKRGIVVIVSYFDDDDDVKGKMVPVVIGTPETISRSFRKYLNNIQGKYEIREVKKRKTAVLDITLVYILQSAKYM